MRAAEKVIITTAVTGSVNIPSQSPYLPLSADEVAQAAIEAVEAEIGRASCRERV